MRSGVKPSSANETVFIEFFDDSKSGLTFSVNGKAYQEVYSWPQRLESYERAIDKFDEDINSSYDLFDSDFILNHGESIRGDSIRSARRKSVIWYYYVFELIERLREHDVVVISRSKFIDKFFLLHLKRYGYSIKVSLVSRVLMLGYSSSSFLKILAKSVSELAAKPRRKAINSYPPFGSHQSKTIAIDVPSDEQKHRYGYALADAKKSRNVILFCSASGLIYLKEERVFKIASFVNLSKKINFFLVSLFLVLRRNRVESERIYHLRLKSVSFFSVYRSIVAVESIKNIIEELGIDELWLSGAFTNGPKKALINACYQKNIESVCFFPRPLTEFRPAERLSEEEREHKNKNLLASYFVVRDKHSELTAQSQGLPKDKLRSLRVDVERCPIRQNIKTVVVILGVNEAVNDRLIELVLSEECYDFSDWVVVVKPHPLVPLKNARKVALSDKFAKWHESQSKDYYGHGAIAVTACSTASVEAAVLGSGVVWCPFLDEESLMMWPIIKKFGFVANSVDSFSSFFRNNSEFKSIASFGQRTKAQALKEFSHSECVDISTVI